VLDQVEISLTLKEEIKVVNSCDTSIHYGPGLGIPIIVSLAGFSWVESGVMTFPTYDDTELWSIRSLGCVEGLECCLDKRHLFFNNNIELTLESNQQTNDGIGINNIPTSETPSRYTRTREGNLLPFLDLKSFSLSIIIFFRFVTI